MPKSMLSVYEDLQEKLSTAAAATERMTSTSDLSVKKYRFRLQNAVTATINSISANSGEDLRGKISRLRRLIRGESIDVMGKPLSIRDHPAAKMYCCNLLAKKLVVSILDRKVILHILYTCAPDRPEKCFTCRVVKIVRVYYTNYKKL